MFRLTIDLIFPITQEHKKLIEQEERRESQWKGSVLKDFKAPLKGYADDENLWEEISGLRMDLKPQEEINNPEAFQKEPGPSYHSR